MRDELFADRRKALEESFFTKENAALLERLKAQEWAQATKAKLAEISGIEDDEVLGKIVDLGIDLGSWAAISLIPLVEVAWADGKVEDKERRAVMSAAEANGILPSSPSFELLERWLTHRPDGRLMEAWGGYIVDLCATLEPAEVTSVRDKVVGRAREVATATGGFLGLGSKISPEEEIILTELAKAFG
jgi:hypothetical protein